MCSHVHKRCHVTNCSDVPQQVSNTVHTPYIDQSKLMPTPETHINPPNLYSCRVLSPSRNLSICSKKRHGAGGRRRGRRRSLGPGAGGCAAPGEAVGRPGNREPAVAPRRGRRSLGRGEAVGRRGRSVVQPGRRLPGWFCFL